MQRDDDVWMPADHEVDNVVPMTAARTARKVRNARSSGSLSDLEISERFVKRYAGELRYCGPLGGWHAWSGTHFELDSRERARECAKQTARDVAAEAASLMDDELFRAAMRAGSDRGVSGILNLARSAPEIVFAADDANRGPWALNVLNGTIDLRTGALRPHKREDLMTRCCNAVWDESATAPRFEQFLAEVQPNPEVRAYLARLFGYAAAGIVREHVLGVLWGAGANGKSVLAEVVSHVLGDYARPGPSSLIVGDGYQPHPTDIATLVGARLVLVHETKRGASFDSSKVKMLTGGDKLTARHMRQDFFEFAPSHTLIMLSNYRPQADATDAALWRRVHLVPFEVVVPVERRDPTLSEAIRGEASGVLRWLVEGAREWQRIGLAPPAVVREQTEAYRASEDTIGQFLEECTVKLAQASVKAGALYAAFRRWCEDNGRRAANGNDFAAEMKGRGVDKVKRSQGLLYIGIGLHADADDRGEP